jgi:hypothetical protein
MDYFVHEARHSTGVTIQGRAWQYGSSVEPRWSHQDETNMGSKRDVRLAE